MQQEVYQESPSLRLFLLLQEEMAVNFIVPAVNSFPLVYCNSLHFCKSTYLPFSPSFLFLCSFNLRILGVERENCYSY